MPIDELETYQCMTEEIKRDYIEGLEIEYSLNLIPQHAEFFSILLYDLRWATFYMHIASMTAYDKGPYRTIREKKLDSLYGLLGELAVKEKLRRMRAINLYNEREFKFFEKQYPEPFDFVIATKDGDYITLEIKTIKEYPHHRHMLIPEGEWKMSDYAIAVKMLKFETTKTLPPEKAKITSVVGYGCFAGYLKKEEIEELRIRPAGESPCTEFPCRAIKLIDISHPISELWELIDSKAIKWEP